MSFRQFAPQAIRIGVTLIVILCCLTPRAWAEDEWSDGAVAGAVLVVGTAIAITAVNVVQIKQGDGSKLWGGLGIAFCAFEWALWGNDKADIAAGVVGGLGLWSFVLSFGENEKKPTATMRFTPALIVAQDDEVRPGMAMSINF